MRMLCCLLLTLTACTSHEVRCDRHLRPINPPRAGMAPLTGEAPAAGTVPVAGTDLPRGAP